MLELSMVSETDLLEAMASAYGLAVASPSDATRPHDPAATRRFPEQWAKKYSLAPVAFDPKTDAVSVMCSVPPDLTLLTQLGKLLEINLKPMLAPELRVHQRLALLYAIPPAGADRRSARTRGRDRGRWDPISAVQRQLRSTDDHERRADDLRGGRHAHPRCAKSR